MTGGRIRRRGDKAPDDLRRTRILKRRLRHQCRLARARGAVEYERPELVAMEIVCDGIQFTFAALENASALSGKAVVSFDLYIE